METATSHRLSVKHRMRLALARRGTCIGNATSHRGVVGGRGCFTRHRLGPRPRRPGGLGRAPLIPLRFVMPVIRISQQTWTRLKAHAAPLEHTPNDIIGMALDALDAAKRKRTAVSSAPEKIRKPRSRRSNRYSQKEI